MSLDFKEFSDIKRYSGISLTITQKIHGSNAQILIYKNPNGEFELRAGSRKRWLSLDDDNYGFAAFVEQYRTALIEKLGEGRHFGEWFGLGINSGEGLSKKNSSDKINGRMLALFNVYREYPLGLPPACILVPILFRDPEFKGSVHDKIIETLADLKSTGSKVVPGFMKPEGVVVEINGTRYKQVFEAEESPWRGVPRDKTSQKERQIRKDYSSLLQPLRLEKLLSRDEKYSREFPGSLPQIMRDYVADLVKEGEITGDEDDIKLVTRGASSQIFTFIKTWIEQKKAP